MKHSFALLTAAFSIFALTGCNPPAAEPGDGAAERAGAAVDAAGAEVKEETKEASQAVEKAAVETAEGVEDAADAASMTTRVRTAITSADGLDIDDLNVDTKPDVKTVTLMGRAKTAADKDRAQKAAQAVIDPATGYKLVNQIMVGGVD